MNRFNTNISIFGIKMTLIMQFINKGYNFDRIIVEEGFLLVVKLFTQAIIQGDVLRPNWLALAKKSILPVLSFMGFLIHNEDIWSLFFSEVMAYKPPPITW